MDPIALQQKWITRLDLEERTASQSHFSDLCAVLGQPNPIEADSTGAFYTFERGAEKAGGGDGWGDVWYRGQFVWNYRAEKELIVPNRLIAAYSVLRRREEVVVRPIQLNQDI